MEWFIDKKRPICPQICEQLCLRIADGTFAPHAKILSVREIAVAAGVNPNTVQHSLDELERKGILYSVRGSGWFVGEDVTLAKKVFAGILAQNRILFFLGER